MLNKNDYKVIEKLLENIDKDMTITDITLSLKQKYAQTYRTIENLHKKGLILIDKIGKSKVIRLDFTRFHEEYAIAEMQRAKRLNNKTIDLVKEKLLDINQQFICVLFGSYSDKSFKKDSDIDLLFVIPKEYDMNMFERKIRSALTIYKTDINIITEESLFEMWSNMGKLSVGNEILKNHIILIGSESFVNILRKKYVGR